MTETSPYSETIPFWLNIIPLHLIIVLLYVGSAQITGGDLPKSFLHFSIKLLCCQNS